ncbi:unnamed protein product [Clavelina lepadiformis]|uniref:Uncharacterized protein n=2 Tax=Clavelina lepadiformis TaxID=159417 RepID=A0ABP0GI78_CLALP
MTSNLASFLGVFKKYTKVSEKSEAKSHGSQVLKPRNSTNALIKLVIFDKDGTLTSFDAMWAPWCEEVAQQLQKKTGLDVSNETFCYFNYNPKKKKIGKGALAEKTHQEIQTELACILSKTYLFDYEEIYQIIVKVWDSVQSMKPHVDPTCNLIPVFKTLKASDIKIAICTSDNRKNTLQALKALNVRHFVDYIMCGDDVQSTPKPAPDNAHFICSKVGVTEKHTAMIGDTPADTQMGKRSGLGLVIGVLSGVGDKSDLSPDADVIVHNVEKSLPLILNPDLLTDASNSMSLCLD